MPVSRHCKCTDILAVSWEYDWHILTVQWEAAWCCYTPQFVAESCGSCWCIWQSWDLVVMEWLLLSRERKWDFTSEGKTAPKVNSVIQAADLHWPLLIGARPELSTLLELQRPTELGDPFPKRCHYFCISTIINNIFHQLVCFQHIIWTVSKA